MSVKQHRNPQLTCGVRYGESALRKSCIHNEIHCRNLSRPYYLSCGDPALAPRAAAHAVSFYERDAELVEILTRFVDRGTRPR